MVTKRQLVTSVLDTASFLASLNYLGKDGINRRACGATIISPQVLVTSDLCVTELGARFGEGKMNVVAGSIPLTSRSVSPGYSALLLNSDLEMDRPLSNVTLVSSSVCQNLYQGFSGNNTKLVCIEDSSRNGCRNYTGGDPIVVYTITKKLALAGIYGGYSYNGSEIDCSSSNSALLSNSLVDYLAFLSVSTNLTIPQLVTSERLLNNSVDNGTLPLINQSLSELANKLSANPNSSADMSSMVSHPASASVSKKSGVPPPINGLTLTLALCILAILAQITS
ncbi:hypothetical protein AYI68_g172 [Smittium mucronatum]|uniref:Peptidase S1 domain-containing protein n=1 Tax=Smittium mucronatum TaxID=133383 RepID=A0A1R0H951_9FUNG|nr:hypothetical protein AYI68_g172 [Smittium mucronatum]